MTADAGGPGPDDSAASGRAQGAPTGGAPARGSAQGAPAGGAPAGGVGATLPGWALRVVLAAAIAVTVVAVAGWATRSPFPLLIAAVLGGVTVALPASHAATVFLAFAAVCGLAADGAIIGWLSLAVLGAHATHVAAALSAVIPARASAEWAALLPTLRRFALAQAAGQLLVLLAWLLS